VDWHLGNPRPQFEVELVGGPFDGKRLVMLGDGPTGVPGTRLRVPIPPTSPLHLTTTNTTNVPLMSCAMYERGEAIRDTDHTWPYNFIGIF